MTDAKYDLDTIHGVLRALADGHTLVSDNGLELRAENDKVNVYREGKALHLWAPFISSGYWQLAPKDVAAMTTLELARELWGDAVAVRCSSLRDSTHWAYDPLLGIDRLSAPTIDELVSMLRALVKARRAGEM